MLSYVLFEDPAVRELAPLTHLRPSFDLRCGHFTLRERLACLAQGAEFSVLVRPELAPLFHEELGKMASSRQLAANDSPTLFVNGRWLPEWRNLEEIPDSGAGWCGEELAYVVTPPGTGLPEKLTDAVTALHELALKSPPMPAGGVMLRHPWDLVTHNPRCLVRDFELRSRVASRPATRSQLALIGSDDLLWVDDSAVIDPFVVIDTTFGPVWIDAQARIQAFTRIAGPAYIGPQSQLFRAQLRSGVTVGPGCRVGGEVEESVLHADVNKYHDGFLGHSYVCPWVNLGALTSNSDLKNDYSEVRVPMHGESRATGSNKIGCFIGDHTKFAIGSLINTGSHFGVMSLILPGGELLPKFTPSFTRVWHGALQPLPGGCEPSIETARTVLSRRQQELTPAAAQLLRHVYQATEVERQAAFTRAAARTL